MLKTTTNDVHSASPHRLADHLITGEQIKANDWRSLFDSHDKSDFTLTPSDMGLLTFAWPIMTSGIAPVERMLKRLTAQSPAHYQDSKTILSDLVKSLLARLKPVVTRTLLLELNVARLVGGLAGDNGEARYASFLQLLGQREKALAILREYPVVADCLCETIQQWQTASIELLSRLDHDYSRIMSHCFAGQLLSVIRIHSDSGDTHHNGRSVCVIEFEQGRRIVYKPRSMAGDRAWNQLLTWLNQRNPSIQLASFSFIDHQDWGWVEFVEQQPLSTPEKAASYYEQLGAMIALMYVLGGTDIHYENLIAAGDSPIVVDLETLFSPAISKHLAYNVTCTALLPVRHDFSIDKEGMDIGAMSAKDGAKVDRTLFGVSGAKTDDMSWREITVQLDGKHNLPTHEGNVVGFEGRIDDIQQGFDAYLTFLQQQAESLLAEDSPLKAFQDISYRFLLQSSDIYQQLLIASYHPDLLRKPGKRAEFLAEQLARFIDSGGLNNARIASEQQALLANNIPVFYHQPESCDLLGEAGTPINDYFAVSGMQALRNRLEHATDRPHQWSQQSNAQSLLVAMALTQQEPALLRTMKPQSFPQWCAMQHHDDKAIAAALTSSAEHIGDSLLQAAIRDKDCVNWFGYEQTPGNWALTLAEDNLYDGNLGIALFLACLSEITGRHDYSDCAEQALHAVFQDIARSSIVKQAGFTGLGGAIYVLAYMLNDKTPTGTPTQQQADRQCWLRYADDCLTRLESIIEQDTNVDVMAGNAGAVQALIYLSEVPELTSQARLLATKAGEHLLNQFLDDGADSGWIIPEHNKTLTGFSHGSSGIALALANLTRRWGDDRFLAIARKAITAENQQFCDVNQNWPDKRDGLESVWRSTWCHGAAGITLSRCMTPELADSDTIQHDLAVCAFQLQHRDKLTNHSLCHGLLGNLSIAQTLALHSDEVAVTWQQTFIDLRQKVFNHLDKHGFRTATPDNHLQFSLMNGLAGMGLILLRLIAPNRIPDVLALAGPSAKT